jgi:hypothetical protein
MIDQSGVFFMRRKKSTPPRKAALLISLGLIIANQKEQSKSKPGTPTQQKKAQKNKQSKAHRQRRFSVCFQYIINLISSHSTKSINLHGIDLRTHLTHIVF